jgi:hypothetical protein
MIFATVRWGLPNVAAIVAMAALPLLSLVMLSDKQMMLGDKQMASTKFESADFQKPTPLLRIAAANIDRTPATAGDSVSDAQCSF